MELVAQQPTQEIGHETIANKLVAGSDYARVTESLGWEVGTGPLHWPGFKFFLCHSFAVWPKINDTSLQASISLSVKQSLHLGPSTWGCREG